MTYDDWKTTPPDDDPDGEAAEREDRCPDCGVGPDDPCELGCQCVHCRRLAAREELRLSR